MSSRTPARSEQPVSVSPRAQAVQICLKVVEKRQSLDDLLAQFLPRLNNDRDRAFCSELCFGFCRYYFLLEQCLSRRLKKPLKVRDRDIQVILLLGLYQIRFMRVENHAAVNESVKLLKKRGKVWAKGLVNALLRGYIRDLGDTQSDELSEPQQPLTYPPWMRKMIELDWREQAAEIFRIGNMRAPMTLRVHTRQISRQEYLQQLLQAGNSARIHPVIESALLLEQPVAVEQLPGFAQGLVSVQDASAQIAAELLDVKPGMTVLDACAAPGGKTLHIGQRTDDIHLLALDKDPARLERVQENLQRGGLHAQCVAADAGETKSWFDGQCFDRILLDAPCTASGIIRRHPDIRLLRQPNDVQSLVQQQRRLLDSLWPLLKNGGKMVYSTCSIFRQENEQQILAFLQRQDNAAEVPLKAVQWGQPQAVGRQILPDSQMDGFYYALLQKKQ